MSESETPTPTPTDDAETPDASAPDPSAQPDDAPDATTDDDDDTAESFPRDYVEKLRGESHRYRKRAQAAEATAGELSAALWSASVAATDQLADPADLPMPADADPLDAEAVAAAVADLLERRPHLAARRARGDVGAHERGDDADPVSLAALLRRGA